MARRMAQTRVQRTDKGSPKCLCAQHVSTTGVVRVKTLPRGEVEESEETLSTNETIWASLDNSKTLGL